jgi:hypothetical protein
MKLFQKKVRMIDLVGKPFLADLYISENGLLYDRCDNGDYCRMIYDTDTKNYIYNGYKGKFGSKKSNITEVK